MQPDPKKKGEMQRVQIREMRPVLQVSGYAVNDEEGIKSVEPLAQRTSEDLDFSTKFELLPATTSDTLFGEYPVRSFTLQYWINSSVQKDQASQ